MYSLLKDLSFQWLQLVGWSRRKLNVNTDIYIKTVTAVCSVQGNIQYIKYIWQTQLQNVLVCAKKHTKYELYNIELKIVCMHVCVIHTSYIYTYICMKYLIKNVTYWMGASWCSKLAMTNKKKRIAFVFFSVKFVYMEHDFLRKR